MVAATLFTILFLPVGFVIGWISHETFMNHIEEKAHPFNDIITQNPHPELFDDKGKIIGNDYMALTFDLGYDPEEFEPEDISEGEA